MEWKTIESAPKTNKSILVWCPRTMCVYTAVWWNDRWEHFGGSTREIDEHPSHWAPIPEGPK